MIESGLAADRDSGRGLTVDGFTKPELVAPGVHIVSTLAKHSMLADAAAGSTVQGRYIDLSGTSASAARTRPTGAAPRRYGVRF